MIDEHGPNPAMVSSSSSAAHGIRLDDSIRKIDREPGHGLAAATFANSQTANLKNSTRVRLPTFLSFCVGSLIPFMTSGSFVDCIDRTFQSIPGFQIETRHPIRRVAPAKQERNRSFSGTEGRRPPQFLLPYSSANPRPSRPRSLPHSSSFCFPVFCFPPRTLSPILADLPYSHVVPHWLSHYLPIDPSPIPCLLHPVLHLFRICASCGIDHLSCPMVRLWLVRSLVLVGFNMGEFGQRGYRRRGNSRDVYQRLAAL